MRFFYGKLEVILIFELTIYTIITLTYQRNKYPYEIIRR